MTADAYRLTPQDEQRVTTAVTAYLSPMADPHDAAARLAAARVGAHAIGCSAADLRDVENEWIAEQVIRAANTIELHRAADRWTKRRRY